MRTIEFRAKKVRNGEWVAGSLVTETYNRSDGKQFEVSFIVNGLPSAVESNDMRLAKMWRVNPETIGQYTSLRDKFGTPIFEGDILKVGDEIKALLEVRFVRGVFAFLWYGNLDDEFPCNAPTQEWAEVVGNIHDNPELVK